MIIEGSKVKRSKKWNDIRPKDPRKEEIGVVSKMKGNLALVSFPSSKNKSSWSLEFLEEVEKGE